MARKLIVMLSLFAVLAGCSRDKKPESTASTVPESKPTVASVSTLPKVTAPEKPPPKAIDDTAGLGLSGDEKTLLDQIHQARDNAKQPRLKVNPVLVKLARGHAERMAKENLQEQVQIPQAVYASRSSASRTGTNNMLDPADLAAKAHKELSERDYEEFGLGIAVNGAGQYCFVMIFAQPAQP